MGRHTVTLRPQHGRQKGRRPASLASFVSGKVVSRSSKIFLRPQAPTPTIKKTPRKRRPAVLSRRFLRGGLPFFCPRSALASLAGHFLARPSLARPRTYRSIFCIVRQGGGRRNRRFRGLDSPNGHAAGSRMHSFLPRRFNNISAGSTSMCPPPIRPGETPTQPAKCSLQEPARFKQCLAHRTVFSFSTPSVGHFTPPL